MATGGYRVDGAGGSDAFPAMSGSRRPVRRLRPVREAPPTLGEAVDAFLARPDLASSSHRSYAQTFARLQDGLGAERPVERLGAVDRHAWW